MLSLFVLTPSTGASEAIRDTVHGSKIFELVFEGWPESLHSSIRLIQVHDPEVVLLDVSEWQSLIPLIRHIQANKLRATLVGFGTVRSRAEQLEVESAGVVDFVREGSSPTELEAVVYDAVHRQHPLPSRNILAFLPAKAGGGCSTVTLNTAAALARIAEKRVLLVEGDRRSGVLSMLLGLENRGRLSQALERAGRLTSLEWDQLRIRMSGFDLLLANLRRRGPLPSWADYYQLLRFLHNEYDFLFCDLPELVNEASVEVVKSARAVLIVCTPEVPSLHLANQRLAELQECEIPAGKIHIVLNRWQRGRISLADVEKALAHKVLATLPNAYKSVTDAILESRLALPESAFGKACMEFAQALSGLPHVTEERFALPLLKRLLRLG